MKRFNLKLIILPLLVFLLPSCTKMLYTSLDVLRPAKASFSPEVKNLLIVNNTVLQPYEYGHKTQLINDQARNVRIEADSLAIFCLGAITEEFDSKAFFTNINLISNTINPNLDFTRITQIEKTNIKSLCEKYNVDAVLSLDRLKVNDDLSEFYIPETSQYLASLEVKYESIWSINYPDNKISSNLRFNDTIYWESDSNIRKKAFEKLPIRSNALIDGALLVGQRSVNRFIPYWEKVDRYFYNPNKKIPRQAMDLVYVKNWSGAIDLWEKALLKHKSAFYQYQLMNNIAIAYEISGNIDKALEYVNLSFEKMSKLNIVDYKAFMLLSDYLSELNKRKKEINLVKVQLGD